MSKTITMPGLHQQLYWMYLFTDALTTSDYTAPINQMEVVIANSW